MHTIRGVALRALRKLQRAQQPPSPFVFTTERKGPMTPDGVRKLLTRIGEAAGLPFPVHPHMLRHACGYELQKDKTPTRVIQAWLGHADICHTVRSHSCQPSPSRTCGVERTHTTLRYF